MSDSFVLTTEQDNFSLSTETEFNAPATDVTAAGTRTIPTGSNRTTPSGDTRTFVYVTLADAKPILLTTDQDSFNLTTEQ